MAEQLVAVVKRDCPTCQMTAPVLKEIAEERELVVYTQDDPTFPKDLPDVRLDATLEQSHRLDIHTVPTLIRMVDGTATKRVHGWERNAWRQLTKMQSLGEDLPESRPGCGARNVEPGMPERLALRFGDLELSARRVEVSELDDPIEVAHDRGWSDGLPVVPPTELRVARMLAGTARRPDEVVGRIPPNMNEGTVEKVAINAVMAGCRPEYLPVVIATVEAALIPEFAMHGLLCTLGQAGPMVIVNGPVTRRIGMNWGGNALGQGNRANATIGRALQLVLRNIGGGRPGEIDRAVLGNPGKYTLCFAEDETDPSWEPLSVSRGFPSRASTVTLFHAEAVRDFGDTLSRTPEQLIRSLAMALWGVTHPKASSGASGGAVVVLTPEHWELCKHANWRRADIEQALWEELRRPAREVARDVDGIPVGVDPSLGDALVDKFARENFLLVRAGGRGGPRSAIISGWVGQSKPQEIRAVTKEIVA